MNMKVSRLVSDAMLVAMYFVLSLVSIDLWGLKITLSGLPIIMAGVLFGPIDGVLVGALGGLMQQTLQYGFTATTVLWLLPMAARGLIVGLYAKWRTFDIRPHELTIVIVISSIVVTALNTFAWYIDSVVYGYYSYAVVFGGALMRFVAGVLTAIVFSVIVPLLLRAVDKIPMFSRRRQ